MKVNSMQTAISDPDSRETEPRNGSASMPEEARKRPVILGNGRLGHQTCLLEDLNLASLDAESLTYLSSNEAAYYLGISKSTFLRAVNRGEIQPILRTPGGYQRFLLADIKVYLRQLSPRWQASKGKRDTEVDG